MARHKHNGDEQGERGYTPTIFGATKGRKPKKELTPEEREARVALMAERYANGCDLWTGLPLPGKANVPQDD